MALRHTHVEANSWPNCTILNKRAPLYGPSGILCSSRHVTCCHLHPLTYWQISPFARDCLSPCRSPFDFLHSAIRFLLNTAEKFIEKHSGSDMHRVSAVLIFSTCYMRKVGNNCSPVITVPHLVSQYLVKLQPFILSTEDVNKCRWWPGQARSSNNREPAIPIFSACHMQKVENNCELLTVPYYSTLEEAKGWIRVMACTSSWSIFICKKCEIIVIC